MGPRSRVRVAKCQMLVTGLFVLLLGLSVATMAVITRFGAPFTVISHVSLERNPYEPVHRWAFSVGVSLAGLLTLGAILCVAATVREAVGLMAGAFLCFALVFCILVQVAFWRFHNPTQVEDAVLDTYDLVYEQAVRSPASTQGQELAAIQDTLQCCGKRSPFGRMHSEEAGLCPGELAGRERPLASLQEQAGGTRTARQAKMEAASTGDCLQGLRSFLKTHLRVATALASLSLVLTVYALLLSSFLWAAIRSGCSLDRRGTYTLTPRARHRRPREPSVSRYSKGGPNLQHHSETQALDDRLGQSGHASSPGLCEHN